MNIEGKVALITGAASGLGRAAACHLHERGATVVLVDLPASPGEAVTKGLERAVFTAADVADEGEVGAAVDVARGLGSLSIVVNCAGVAPAARVVGRDGAPASLHHFAQTVQTNLVGSFNVIRLTAAAMIGDAQPDGEERGVIINTASIAAFDGQIGQAAYAASKSGVVGLTLPVARDLAQHRIRVNTIAPGLFLTPLVAALPQRAIRSLGDQVPHPQRLGAPDEFASLVVHIVENPMLNGETIRLDGGIRMAPK